MTEITDAVDRIPGLRLLTSNDHKYNTEGRWWVQLKWEGNGMKLEVEGQAPTFDEALEKAFDSFRDITRYGIPERDLAPQLEAPKTTALNDEIPY
tara:strand:- start:159 stop:443 length:285 start_codon:yes stop_codon:yes gene_type:complete